MELLEQIIIIVVYLVENCTGLVLENKTDSTLNASECTSLLGSDSQDNSDTERPGAHNGLDEFTKYDEDDTIYEEFDPPQGQENHPKAWKENLVSIRSSLWQCFRSVFLIQTVAGCAIGLWATFLFFFAMNTSELCLDFEKEHSWIDLPLRIQRIRVAFEAVQGCIIQMWNFLVFAVTFRWFLIKDLNLLVLNILAGFTDTIYRLYFQVFGIYHVSWMSYPLNALFALMIFTNGYLLGRHVFPNSLRGAFKLSFVINSQFIVGMPATFFVVYFLLPWYAKQDTDARALVAVFCPLITAIPKVVARLGAQGLSAKIVHPGHAHVLVATLYGASALVFRVMQGDASDRYLFVALGIAHATVDLFERITITMRDEIWEYIYSVIRRKNRRRQQRYRSPRSRRFIADVSIHIMLQESASLVGALGYIYTFQFLYSRSHPYRDMAAVYELLARSALGLAIDLCFGTLSVFIQTRVMNIAVNRVWSAKWRYHMVVNIITTTVVVLYFKRYLFDVVRTNNKEKVNQNDWNCTSTLFFS